MPNFEQQGSVKQIQDIPRANSLELGELRANDRRLNSVLIVDDTPTNIKVLFSILEQSGFIVSVAKNGESALEKVIEASPNLILLDVLMPGIDGFETCRRLKENPSSRDIPVIFLSALDETVDKVRGFAAGGVDYITKPFQAAEVLARVENQLALQAARLEVQTLNLELEQRVQQRTAQLEAANQELAWEIAERKKIEEALLKREEEFQLTFDLAPIGMAIKTLEGQFLRVNQSLCDTLKYSSQELLNYTWADVIDSSDLSAFLMLYEKLRQGDVPSFKVESRYRSKDGRLVFGILQVALVRDAEGQPLHLISQFMDITDRKRAEDQLLYSALHDTLTQLPNRSLLTERLEHALRRAQRQENYIFAVLFIDLDRFKIINDSLGHQVGDELLIAIGQKLKMLVRAADTVARLGGDEFVVLIDPIDDLNHAIRVADRIANALQSSFHIGGRDVFITSSIGITLSSRNYQHASDLLRDADLAMYRAKEKGKARYEVFNQELYAQVREQLQLESDLRQALEQQEFLVYYQPIVSLKTDEVIGFEALLRWQHPTRGLITPGEFIAVAEEMGLIVPLGNWVLQTACRQMQRWRQQFQATALKVSVNLSVKQLKEPNFLEKIDQILQQTGLPGHSLQLELTEGTLIDEVERLIEILSQLCARSIELSIDDFGTGYSSLNYLHRFPVSHLKIAQAFVSRIGEQGENGEIVETIITLAHQLGMQTIAEGIETPQQLAHLKALNCEAAQGYWFARPLAQTDAEALVARLANVDRQS